LRVDPSKPLILYFGGNAEDVLYSAAQLRDLNFGEVLAVNYRGYGGSSGEPGQDALYADALRIYDYAVEQGAIPSRIVVLGRSLGSGVASMLAAQRPLAAAILVTPFDSLSAVAAGHYPYVPVRWLLKHRFASTQWAAATHSPALILAAEHDSIVPSLHARVLAEHWAGEKEFHLLENVGHNDIDHHSDYYALIQKFLDQHASRSLMRSYL
jgi:pimeloyl-ACP methyl ester carboxylesterase